MPNGDDVADVATAPTADAPADDKSKWPQKRYREPSTGKEVTLRYKPGTDLERVKMRAQQMLAQREHPVLEAATNLMRGARDIPGAFVHGAAKGVAGGAPLAQAAQLEMGQIDPSDPSYAPVPGVKETTQILEQQLPKGVPHQAATTGPGKVAETFGEALTDLPTWIGPGGPIRKTVTALTGAIGSTVGEKYGGTIGKFIGGAVGGGVGGWGLRAPGLPGRIPSVVRKATTDEALYDVKSQAYQQLDQFQYQLGQGQGSTLLIAIKQYMRSNENMSKPIAERVAPKAYGTLDDYLLNATTVSDVERTRQALNVLRIEGGTEALAASKAIEVIDDYMYALPGIEGVSKVARETYAAMKRGQTIEETIRRGIQRAKTSGTGANESNAIKQEFGRLKNTMMKKGTWNRFSKAEQEQIDYIIDSGGALNVVRWASKFSPQHIVTAALAWIGVGGHATLSPMDQLKALAMFGSGEAAKQYLDRMTRMRAQRLMEATRARSPPGGAAAGLEPGQSFIGRPAPSPLARAGYGAARSLGATALSPETTERLELPEWPPP
jgi:hypothetical protein